MVLVLFSGGVESSVLLKYLLKETKLLVHVLHTKLAYCDSLKLRIPEQEKSSNNILDYFKKNYREFNYSSLELKLDNINEIQQEKHGFGYDEQWNIFFASMYAKIYQIKNIWIGQFSYNDDIRKDFNLGPLYWFYDGTLERYALLGSGLDFNFYKDLKINFPSRNFKKQGIDSFKSKKEAFDYLEPEVKKLVRSCFGKNFFCGKCIKCIQYVKYKLTNKKGEII